MKVSRYIIVVFFAIMIFAADSAITQEVEVSREGRWRIWYTSPDLRAELDTHWADGHLGDEWIILKLALSGGTSGGVTTVSRDRIRLRTPDGVALDLPTQAEFRGVRGSMSSAFQQENAWGPPAARFVGSKRRVIDWFFSPPGTTFHRENVYPSTMQYFAGPLVFEVPGGVQPGEWKLIIDLEETRAEIPFVLGENES